VALRGSVTTLQWWSRPRWRRRSTSSCRAKAGHWLLRARSWWPTAARKLNGQAGERDAQGWRLTDQDRAVEVVHGQGRGKRIRDLARNGLVGQGKWRTAEGEDGARKLMLATCWLPLENVAPVGSPRAKPSRPDAACVSLTMNMAPLAPLTALPRWRRCRSTWPDRRRG